MIMELELNSLCPCNTISTNLIDSQQTLRIPDRDRGKHHNQTNRLGGAALPQILLKGLLYLHGNPHPWVHLSLEHLSLLEHLFLHPDLPLINGHQ
jgi:hypothetical protein